ncbi:MAG: hypothetical protein SPLM_08490 [Spiroplasma phoeniceum]|uniref:hypothetical protein n=1 Tax=Spiroplasma phoeniceum TaxID=47835 RepID=UPI00327EDBAD
MKKLLESLLVGTILFGNISPLIACKTTQEENLNFDLAQIDETVFQNYSWTVDQMLGSELGGFQTLRSTILKIIKINFEEIDLFKINVDIYYGYHTTPNSNYLIDFSAVRNLLPITYFSIHITPNNYGHYQNEKWITINTNVDLTELNILKNSVLFYSDNPVPFDNAKLIVGFVQNINNIFQTEEGYEEIVAYYKNKKMWNDNNPLPFGFFNLEIKVKKDSSNFVKFDESRAMLIFNSTVVESNYKVILESKGFSFYKKPEFLSVWNVSIDSNDFNAKDWRNIDWKPIANKTYAGTTTIAEVVNDVTDYLIKWSAHVHNSHFMQATDVNVVLKKGAKSNDLDLWSPTTQLKNLWKSADHGGLPYVFAWFKSSNKNYLKINHAAGTVGTHVSFKIT